LGQCGHGSHQLGAGDPSRTTTKQKYKGVKTNQMKNIRSIHPFPARMAPELALQSLNALDKKSVVLDPMAGSGTVLRHALALGHSAIGFDMDPLAVLMSTVWTSKANLGVVEELAAEIVDESRRIDLRLSKLPWIERGSETEEFAKYWFGPHQRQSLKRLAFVLHHHGGEGQNSAELNILRLALSRIIVTKEQGASLARDTSHSRPHKVAESSNYDVFTGFMKSVSQVVQRLHEQPITSNAKISLGDARRLKLAQDSVDAVVTSPPYLNAIDYMRGHRLALVWLGYPLEDLRQIRSTSIGAERAPETVEAARPEVKLAMLGRRKLPARATGIVDRYVTDLLGMTQEVSRVLKPGGYATFVVGNSCLNDCYINNASGLSQAAIANGLRQSNRVERALPSSSRYLPVTGGLAKRMRTETVLTFVK
jgi:tRNA G10  N-methylase Trm11